MEITLFTNFQKRANSTLTPPAGTGETVNVKLKRDTDILRPTFLLQLRSFDINYVKWGKRYYNVVGVTVNSDGLMSLSCEVDVLGSYKEDILNTKAHVAYSSRTFSRVQVDERLKPTGAHTVDREIVSLTQGDDAFFNAGGCFVLNIVNVKSNGENGSVSSYLLSKDEMKTFCSKLTSSDLLDVLKNEFSNPLECVISCRWLPFAVSSIQTLPEPLMIANHLVGMHSNMIVNPIQSHTGNFDIIALEGNMTDSPLFTTCSAYLPFVGVVPLDHGAIFPRKRIYYKVLVDVTTGDIVYQLGDAEGNEYMSTFNGNCSTDIPLSSQKSDIGGAVQGLITTIGGAVTSVASVLAAPATGGLSLVGLAGAGAMVGGVGQILKGAETHTMTQGSLGSRLGAQVSLDIIVETVRSVFAEDFDSDTRVQLYGLPLNKSGLISGMAGYIQTVGFSVGGSALEIEKTRINQLMDSGVYLE